jgi:AraC family transcriptional regulator of adaptative response/methylated-DNA-[protein]-cysteine methyltransferase
MGDGMMHPLPDDETLYNALLNKDSTFEGTFVAGVKTTGIFCRATCTARKQKQENVAFITITRVLTPLGPMLAGATDAGVCLLEFIDREMLETQLSRLKRMLRAEFVPGSNRHFEALHQQVQEYFAGKRKEFSLPLVMQGTPFQQDVWKALQAIPYGETRSYQEQAGLLGKPRAVRAVAQANGDNRISIIIPCHRVIGKDGKLVGYGGGLWRKRFLLDLEVGAPRENTL